VGHRPHGFEVTQEEHGLRITHSARETVAIDCVENCRPVQQHEDEIQLNRTEREPDALCSWPWLEDEGYLACSRAGFWTMQETESAADIFPIR
jgi:hypothetical protein